MAYETTYKGEKVTVEIGRYITGQHAIQLVDETGIPYTVATVAISEHLDMNEVAIKNYSENEGMLDWMMKEKLVGAPIRHVNSGFVTIPICPIHEDAITLFF